MISMKNLIDLMAEVTVSEVRTQDYRTWTFFYDAN